MQLGAFCRPARAPRLPRQWHQHRTFALTICIYSAKSTSWMGSCLSAPQGSLPAARAPYSCSYGFRSHTTGYSSP
ncbi:hypothetical protein BDV06DRAFT_195761 [Aspergillus oleicola]